MCILLKFINFVTSDRRKVWCARQLVKSTQIFQPDFGYTFFFYKKPFYKKPRLKSSKITENNKKLFRSITNFLRNLFVVFWHTLRNLTYFCSVFLIFLTYKKSIRNFFDQKLPKSEETF